VCIRAAISFLVCCSVAWARPIEPPILFADGYGQRLLGAEAASSGTETGLWWASSGWKVSQSRELPKQAGEAMHISLARNEYEAVQLVVKPARGLEGFIAEAGALVSESGSVLAAVNVEVLRVRYVNVEHPTDRSSVAAPWPDPLPPFKKLITLEAGKNQPLWVRVHAPKETAPGLYRGFVRLRANSYDAEVPLSVEVYDFTLPDRLTCRTAFGFGTSTVFQYHRPGTEEERRLLIDKYFESMRKHHASPYNPAPFSKMNVKWVKRTPEECAGLPEEDAVLLQEHALTPRFDWDAWDAEVTRNFERFHFSTIRLSIPGMGGGTFYGHGKPSLQGFDEGTRGYWLAFSQYCSTL
jgi:glycosyl hydrolase family 123